MRKFGALFCISCILALFPGTLFIPKMDPNQALIIFKGVVSKYSSTFTVLHC